MCRSLQVKTLAGRTLLHLHHTLKLSGRPVCATTQGRAQSILFTVQDHVYVDGGAQHAAGDNASINSYQSYVDNRAIAAER